MVETKRVEFVAVKSDYGDIWKLALRVEGTDKLWDVDIEAEQTYYSNYDFKSPGECAERAASLLRRVSRMLDHTR